MFLEELRSMCGLSAVFARRSHFSIVCARDFNLATTSPSQFVKAAIVSMTSPTAPTATLSETCADLSGRTDVIYNCQRRSDTVRDWCRSQRCCQRLVSLAKPWRRRDQSTAL